MLRSIQPRQNTLGRAPSRRPAATAARRGYSARHSSHALVRSDDNARLADYEQRIKSSFDDIVPTLKRISAKQHESDFVHRRSVLLKQNLALNCRWMF